MFAALTTLPYFRIPQRKLGMQNIDYVVVRNLDVKCFRVEKNIPPERHSTKQKNEGYRTCVWGGVHI